MLPIESCYHIWLLSDEPCYNGTFRYCQWFSDQRLRSLTCSTRCTLANHFAVANTRNKKLGARSISRIACVGKEDITSDTNWAWNLPNSWMIYIFISRYALLRNIFSRPIIHACTPYSAQHLRRSKSRGVRARSGPSSIMIIVTPLALQLPREVQATIAASYTSNDAPWRHYVHCGSSRRAYNIPYVRTCIRSYVGTRCVSIRAGRTRGRPAGWPDSGALLSLDLARSCSLGLVRSHAPLFSLESSSGSAPRNGGASTPSSAWHYPWRGGLPARASPRNLILITILLFLSSELQLWRLRKRGLPP